MGSYNVYVTAMTRNGSTTSQVLGTTAVAYSGISASVPNKFFSRGQFAIQTTQGVSGAFFVNIVGAVGGATYIIAGRTAISTVGGFPIPQLLYVGVSGSVTQVGLPRPAYAQFGSAGAIVGFTATVFLAADY